MPRTHFVPVEMAETLRSDGLSWPQIVERLWMKTGHRYQPESIARAVRDHRKSCAADAS